MIKKKWVSRSAAAALTLSVGVALVGCAGAESDGGTAKLTFMPNVTDNLTADLWNGLIADFEAENPNIDVELVSPAGQEYQAYGKTLFAAGDFPDIVLGNVDFAQLGALAPLDEEYLTPFNNWEDTAIDGVYYFVPTAIQPQSLMWYNADLFAEAGVEVPSSLDDLDAALSKLAGVTPVPLAVTGEWTTGFQYGVMSTPTVMGETPNWFAQKNAGEVTFADSPWKTTADYLDAWNKAGYFGAGSLSTTFDQGGQSFIAGDSAMYPMGVWFGATLLDTPPAFEPGVFAVPNESGEATVSSVLGLAYSISSQSEEPEAAAEFIKFMSQNEDAARTQLEADGLFSNAIEPVDYDRSGVLKDVADLLAASKVELSSSNGVGDSVPPSGFPDIVNTTVQSLILGQIDGAGMAKALDDWWSANQ